MTMPIMTRRDGSFHAISAATVAVKSGLAPFNIPVSAEETYRSANGNMLNGNAIQNAPSATIFGQSERNTGIRAEGNSERVKKPIASRTNVTPPGPIAPNASAINRYDAPQINPGRERIIQSAAPEWCAETFELELAVAAIGAWMDYRLRLSSTQTKSHFGDPGWFPLHRERSKPRL